MSDLKKAAASGVVWTGTASVLVTVAQLAQVTILARMLAPREFGLMSIVTIVVGLAQTLSDVGISNAIVHRQDISRDQLSSLYWLNIAAAAMVFVATLALTPVAVFLFDEPELYKLIPLSALLFFIAPVGQQFQMLLQRNLKFRAISLIEITSTVVGVIISIGAASIGLGVKSLILGQLSTAAVASIGYASIGFRRWRPGLRLRYSEVKDFLPFGFHQLLTRLCEFASGRADKIIMGALLGPVALGYYDVGWRLMILPISRINPILTRVAFPVLAKVQNDNARLRRGYMMVTWLLSVTNSPILIGAAVTAPILVPLLFGPGWEPSILIMQLLAPVGIIRSILNPMGSLALARGRTDFALRWGVNLVLIQMACVYLGGRLGGTDGVVLGVLVAHVIPLFAHYPLLIRVLLGPCLPEYVGSIAPAVLIALAMGIVVRLVEGLASQFGLWVQLGWAVAVGATFYASVSFLLQSKRVKDAKSVFFAAS